MVFKHDQSENRTKKSASTFTRRVKCDILMIGGGGSGGFNCSAGGGSGAFILHKDHDF